MAKRHVPDGATSFPDEDHDIGFYTAADLKKLGIASHASSIPQSAAQPRFSGFREGRALVVLTAPRGTCVV